MTYTLAEVEAAFRRARDWQDMRTALESPPSGDPREDTYGIVRAGGGRAYIKTGVSNWVSIYGEDADEHYGDMTVTGLPVIPYLTAGGLVRDAEGDRWFEAAPDVFVHSLTRRAAVADYLELQANGQFDGGCSRAHLALTWGPLTDAP